MSPADSGVGGYPRNGRAGVGRDVRVVSKPHKDLNFAQRYSRSYAVGLVHGDLLVAAESPIHAPHEMVCAKLAPSQHSQRFEFGFADRFGRILRRATMASGTGRRKGG